MRIQHVKTEQKEYPIYFGENLIQSFVGLIENKEIFPKGISRSSLLLISDDNVFGLYGHALRDSLKEAGYRVHGITLDSGEESKSMANLMRLYNEAISFGADRGTTVIALGGGVVGDIAGFFAATYMRGIRLIQVPTSLLAQVDSSVGGKTAVNLPQAKNIIGSFYQPDLVVCDCRTLKSLPKRELASGLAEVIKYGLIQDYDFFCWLKGRSKELLQARVEDMEYIAARCCAIKGDIVSLDERETGIRKLLNLGHTIGHALESLTGYQKYTHGEAVAVGMLQALKIALNRGLIRAEYLREYKELAESLELPLKLEGVSCDSLLEKLRLDKKAEGGKMVFILPTGIGKVGVFNDVMAEEIGLLFNTGKTGD